MQIEPHEPSQHHETDAPHKGLAKDSVSLLGSVVLGISSVAPAYALTATIGLVAAEAGVHMPVVFIAGFLPMFLAAYAYRELNRVSPDCGTSFTWTTKAFGPHVGWLGGWPPCSRPSSCCRTWPASRSSSSTSSSARSSAATR